MGTELERKFMRGSGLIDVLSGGKLISRNAGELIETLG
jgi:hypothetical protein